MDFEFTDEQLALRDNARSVLAASCPPAAVRAVHEGEPARPELWATLVELGWPSVGIAAEHGGLGLGFIEVGIVVEELGRVAAPTPFLATVTQLAPLLRETGATDRLRSVADGTRTGTLALAEDGRWELGAVATTARPTATGWVLDGAKSHVLDGASADELAVVARLPDSAGPDGVGVFVVPRAAVVATPMTVIDPTLPLARVALDGVEVASDAVLVEPGDPGAVRAIARSVEEATVALALSTTATCRAIFEATVQYAKDREQFGKPIGSFQALKHRLADLLLAVERSAALAYYAALTVAEDDERRTIAVPMAKAASGDCQRQVVGGGLQLHGGIGFTWEHDLHFLLKRAKTGDLLFGTAAAHRAALARLLGLAA